jgi:hypothetical protein
MNRSRLIRQIRIAASVMCLTVCALFVVLWVRSYTWYDWLVGPLPRSYVIQASTQPGSLELMVSGPAFRVKLWELSSYPIQQGDDRWMIANGQSLGFRWALIQGRLRATTPFWFPVVLAGTLAAVLGIRTYQFSLRSLLFAMTLVAVILGLIVALR